MSTCEKEGAWIAWSSGKDSLWALHRVRQSAELEIVGLLTTITETYGRVSMHAVRESLLEAQAEALGLPMYPVRIPTPCSDDTYGALMRRALAHARELGITSIVFGDISLAGVRAYRESRLAEVGMKAVFPLWGKDTASLADDIIEGGVRAYLTCLDPRKLPRDMAGLPFDSDLLSRLPQDADPCGENGEFHTFAWGGPGFFHPIPVRVGETVERDGFVFTDLMSAPGPSSRAE